MSNKRTGQVLDRGQLWLPGWFCWKEMGRTLGLKRVSFEQSVDFHIYIQMLNLVFLRPSDII